jgi:hypothetical protein
MGEVAASSLVASPTISASAGLVDGAKGFDLVEGDYARVQTDNACWLRIDYGENKFIGSIRFRSGPDSSGSHPQTLRVSTDASTWTTIASWSGQTYYSSISPWFRVNMDVRYIQIDKGAPNWMQTYYMGVEQEPYPAVAQCWLAARRDRLDTRPVSGKNQLA